jgi:hypothetical protein
MGAGIPQSLPEHRDGIILFHPCCIACRNLVLEVGILIQKYTIIYTDMEQNFHRAGAI